MLAQRAKAFASKPPEEAVKAHPELAPAYAAVAAMDKKAEADGLSPQQRAIVNQRVRQNVVNSIERGELPEVAVREAKEQTLARSDERELSR